MKNKFLISMVAIASLCLVGCSNKANLSDTNSNLNIGNTYIADEEGRHSQSADSELYISLYKNMLSDIRLIYENRNIDYDEYSTNNTNFNGVSELYYSNSDAPVNEVSYAAYQIGFDNNNNADSLGAVVAEKVSYENIKNNGYTIDGTIFEDFAKVMVKNSEYKKDVEDAVNDYFKNGGKQIVFLEYNDVDINLEFYRDEISYQIIPKI